MRRLVSSVLALVTAGVMHAHALEAQSLTGALIGTVKDTQGGVLPGAIVRVRSPALMGGPQIVTTNEKGQVRFPALPPGVYALDVEVKGFKRYYEEGIRIGIGATIERPLVLGLKDGLRISRRSRRGASACSILSGPRPGFRPPLPGACRPTVCPRSVPEPTRTPF